MQVNFIRFVGLVAVIAYGPLANAGSLKEDDFNKFKVGEAAQFSNLSSFEAQTVCLLQPYQDRLSSKELVAVRMNKYLAASKYSSDEGHFAFVLIGKEAIEIASFKRSKNLDVLSKHEISSSVEEILPKDFVPHDCASGQSAVFTKVGLQARTYVVLGELRVVLNH